MGNPNIYKYGFGSGYRTKKFDDEVREKSRKPKKRRWSKDYCIDQLEIILGEFKKLLMDNEKINKKNPNRLKSESIRDLNNMMGRILQFMQMLYPPVQKNLNVNIEMTAMTVMNRLKEFKVKQMRGEKIDITKLYDDEEDNETRED